MKKNPVLETNRLRLRRPMVRDIARIVQYANNPKIEEMTLDMPYPYREKDAISWLATANRGFDEKKHYIFVICEASSDQLMGGIGLEINKRFNRGELGFWLGEPFWNNDYMTEAVQKMLDFGFRILRLNKVIAFHMEKNPASGRVLIKNGMIKEGQLAEHIRKGEKYIDVVQYRLTQKEFDAKNVSG